MAEFRMPALGADMDEGTLLEWRVKPGDEIHRGDIIAVVDTAKSAIEVESFHTGTVEALLAPIGETVPVGTVLATITEPGAARATGGPPAAAPGEAAPGKAAPGKARAGKAAPGKARAGEATLAGAAGKRRAAPSEAARPAAATPPATPLVRHLAGELGVDLTALTGTGHGGAITRADVQRAAERQRPVERERPVERQRPVERGRVSPLARRVAAELGVDLAAVTPTGPGGAVREDDVRRAAGAAAQREVPGPAVPGRAAADAGQRAQAMRQAIAALMTRSKREIPHYYVGNTVDMAAAMAWLRERNRALAMSERLVPAALLLRAAALAAREVPQLNGYWEDGHFAPSAAVHLGVAISLRGGGLVTPAIHGADTLSAGDLMGRLRDLVNRARGGLLRRAELTEATITVTNLGDQGVESVTGVIYPPQVALVGFGRIVERPWAVGGLVGARPVVVTTLAADHRATDGYTGARFLASIADFLQRPEEL